MRLHKITNSVYYVGMNDRDSAKFEQLWPLPYGMSYNSYLVKGQDKIALIDTVEQATVHGFIEKINRVLHGEKIDYLIVNHMEPDHSEGIPEILRLFPDLKIVTNRLSIGMLNGYYGISEERCMEINDGSTLDLGSLTLRFVMTPMVHWPETMMTYLEEEKVLFSGDGFGCYGALNGGVVDNEMDTAIYIEEMYRYYSNIVAKFGKFVQMALKKTSCLNIKYLCTTHGPVWHARIKEVVDIYDRLSRYEGEPGVTIVYGTMYGHTSELVEAIATELCEQGVKNIKVHNAAISDMSYMIADAVRYKGLIIGSPTYCTELFPPVDSFMKAIENREIQNRVIATFSSFTWANTANLRFCEYLDRMKQNQVAEMKMKQSFGEDDLEAARQMAQKVAQAL